MNIEKLSEPLPIESVDFRVQSINKGGYATILAYKDARVDMQRLDEAVGPLNWKREHTRDNKNCIVSIWDDSKNQWVSKEDTGTESNTEREKGLASDSFKRACFNWGIGRDLYAYPKKISVKLNDNEWYLDEKDLDKWGNPKPKATYELQPNEWIWFIQWNEGEVAYLAAKQDGKLRFNYGNYLNFDIGQKKIFEEYIERDDAALFYAWFQTLRTEAQADLIGSRKKEKGRSIKAANILLETGKQAIAHYKENREDLEQDLAGYSEKEAGLIRDRVAAFNA